MQPDLATFLVDAACKDATLANYLYWYLQVRELQCGNESTKFSQVECESYENSAPSATSSGRERQWAQMYREVLARLGRALHQHSAATRKVHRQLKAQQAFVARLLQIMQQMTREGGNRARKIDFLKGQLEPRAPPPSTTGSGHHHHKHRHKSKQQQAPPEPIEVPLATEASDVDFGALGSLALPLDPSMHVRKAVAERATLFASARMPARLTFEVEADTPTAYTCIFKHGDDLRQDQLVMQVLNMRIFSLKDVPFTSDDSADGPPTAKGQPRSQADCV